MLANDVLSLNAKRVGACHFLGDVKYLFAFAEESHYESFHIELWYDYAYADRNSFRTSITTRAVLMSVLLLISRRKG
jgi:hypothetical protein